MDERQWKKTYVVPEEDCASVAAADSPTIACSCRQKAKAADAAQVSFTGNDVPRRSIPEVATVTEDVL